MRDVVPNPDSEMVLGRLHGQLVEDAFCHGWRELLGGQAVSSADDPGKLPRDERSIGLSLGEGGDDIQVQGLPRRPRLLGAIQDRHLSD